VNAKKQYLDYLQKQIKELKTEYISNTVLKIQSYIRNGIIPNKNLIMSFETLQYPFDSDMASEIIEKFLI
jgi:hypothetical protein